MIRDLMSGKKNFEYLELRQAGKKMAVDIYALTPGVST